MEGGGRERNVNTDRRGGGGGGGEEGDTERRGHKERHRETGTERERQGERGGGEGRWKIIGSNASSVCNIDTTMELDPVLSIFRNVNHQPKRCRRRQS